MEVPRFPRLRAVQGDRDDRDALLQRHHRGTRAGSRREPRSRWRVPSTKSPSALPSRDDPSHRAHRLAVGLAAAYRKRAERPDQVAETGNAMRLDLRHVVHGARARRLPVRPGRARRSGCTRSRPRRCAARARPRRRAAGRTTRVTVPIVRRPTNQTASVTFTPSPPARAPRSGRRPRRPRGRWYRSRPPRGRCGC